MSGESGGRPRIALVGDPATGKTVLLSVLGHELAHRLGSQLGLAIAAANDPTLRWLADVSEGTLYQRLTLPSSDPAATADPAELVFRITTAPSHSVWPSPRPRHSYITFVDIAGADLADDAAIRRTARWLAQADGIVLLVDPVRLSATGADLEARLESITRAIHQLPGSATKLGQPLDKSLAITVTKLDLVWDDLKETSPLRRPQPAEQFFDKIDGQEVHAAISRYLSAAGANGLKVFANSNYARYQCFGGSALGEAPTANNEVSPRGIRPYRAADPFLWLLSGFGIVRAGNGG